MWGTGGKRAKGGRLGRGALKERAFEIEKVEYSYQSQKKSDDQERRKQQIEQLVFDSIGFGYNPHSMFNLDDASSLNPFPSSICTNINPVPCDIPQTSTVPHTTPLFPNLHRTLSSGGEEEEQEQVHQVRHLISVVQKRLDLRGKQLRAVSEEVMGQYDNITRIKRENSILVEANNQLTQGLDFNSISFSTA